MLDDQLAKAGRSNTNYQVIQMWKLLKQMPAKATGSDYDKLTKRKKKI